MADSSLISKNLIILLIFWSLCFSRTPGSRNEKYQDIFPEVTFEMFDEAVKNKVATWPLKPTEKGSKNDSTTITTVFIFYPSKYQY